MSAKAKADFVVYGSKTRPFLPGKIYARNTAYREGSPLFGCNENLAETSTKLVSLEPVLGVHRSAAESYWRSKHELRLPGSTTSTSRIGCDGFAISARQASGQAAPEVPETERSDYAVNEIIAWLRKLGKIGG